MQIHITVMSKGEAMANSSVLERLMELTNGRHKETETRGSGMRVAMSETYGFRRGNCVIARDDSGTIVGWALVEKQLAGRDYQIGVYVAHEHRLKGIGSSLVRHARQLHPNRRVICDPPEHTVGFFQRLNKPVSDWELYDDNVNQVKEWVHSLHE